MSEEAERIQHRIEETRDRMSETIDALGYKADIPSRVKDSVTEKTQAFFHGVSEQGSSLVHGVSDQGGSAYETVSQTGRRAGGIMQENPLMLALGGMAAGFLLGTLFPATRTESERIGPLAKEARSTAGETIGEALDRGKQVAQDAMRSAVETVKEEVPVEGEELRESLQQKAEHMQRKAQGM